MSALQSSFGTSGRAANSNRMVRCLIVVVKPGVQSADVITVKGRGITKLRGNGRGDLRLGVHVTTPTKLSAKETDLITKLREVRKHPGPTLAGAQQGMFQKFRDRLFGG